ncbi:SRPBCC domain-containing protein [Actinoplanes sp. NPDC051851]|uniref:SRPBCC family protein n=1 Tax=Actinoplanes sp. NPDC051851 TaxID=3154753 RepID=UPI0034236E70
MKINNEFTVRTTIDHAWAVLTDLPGIAPCMPGAQLTGVDGDDYKGKVKVKVGPVVSEFTGTARFTSLDPAGYRAVIDAKGRDPRSAGAASAAVTAVLTPDGDSTRVSVDTDLKISGKLAQFGSGMIKEVSQKLLTQFVTNLEAKLATESPAPTPSDADVPAPVTPVAGAEGSLTPPQAPVSASQDPAPADIPPVSAAPASAVPVPAVPVSAAPVSASSVPAGAEAVGGSVVTAEAEPIDLLGVAGGSIYKRLVPVGVGVAVVAAVVIWLVVRN